MRVGRRDTRGPYQQGANRSIVHEKGGASGNACARRASFGSVEFMRGRSTGMVIFAVWSAVLLGPKPSGWFAQGPIEPSTALAQNTSTGAAGASRTTGAPEVDPRYRQLPAITWVTVDDREQVVARLYRDDGTIDPDTVQRLSWLLRDRNTGEPAPLVPRTLQLLVRIATHFGVDRIEVISGYRTGRRRDGRRIRREGYHSVGSAVDFRLPGVDSGLVAAYARTFAHVGVGWYSRQGFVHLDSREQSFYWECRARRGRRGWNRPLDRTGAAERDAAWNPADDAPWDPPGARYNLAVHVRTHPGSSRRHRHAHHHHRYRHRGHRPLRVFYGAR